MLNYIKAELYKVVRRRYLWIMLIVVILLETLIGLTWIGRLEYDKLVLMMASLLMVGCILVIFLADVVASEPLKSGTIKNEIAFGLPRSQIYLGKLSAAIIVSFGFCAAVYLWYLLGGLMLTDHDNAAVVEESLAILMWVTAAAIPLWMGNLGLAMALLMLSKSTAATVTGVSVFTVAEIILDMLATGMSKNEVGKFAGFLLEILPSSQFGRLEGELTGALMLHCWLVGLGWLVGSTLLGTAIFARRKIK